MGGFAMAVVNAVITVIAYVGLFGFALLFLMILTVPFWWKGRF